MNALFRHKCKRIVCADGLRILQFRAVVLAQEPVRQDGRNLFEWVGRHAFSRRGWCTHNEFSSALVSLFCGGRCSRLVNYILAISKMCITLASAAFWPMRP